MILATNQLMANMRFLNEEELIEMNAFIVAQIKKKRNENARKLKRQLFVGTRVSFDDNRGTIHEGNIDKIMRKFARVNVNGSSWRVPLHALTKVSK